MNYSPGWYFPYDHRLRHPTMFGNSFYPLYNPYETPFFPSPQYPPFVYYHPETRRMTAHKERIPNDDDFYKQLSNLYQLANEPELDHLLRSQTDSILKADPFSNDIGIDFGFGPLRSLASYDIDKTKIRYRDTFNIDDLYLFEAALLSDELITDREKLRRWNQRLNWENIKGIENKRECSSRMPVFEQERIGISPGGWWAYHLFGMPINSTYGYYRLLMGRGGLLINRHDAFRKGKIEAHYPLTGEIKARFPFWRDGGFGLGRCLIAWVEDRPGRTGGTSEESKQKSVKDADTSADAELMNRRLLAQRGVADMINSIMATTMNTILPSLAPPRQTIPGYQYQVPPWKAGIFDHSRDVYPVTINQYERMAGCNFGTPGPCVQNYAGFSNQGCRNRSRSFTGGSRPFPHHQSHHPSSSRETPKSSFQTRPKAGSVDAARPTSNSKKKVKLPEQTNHSTSEKHPSSQKSQKPRQKSQSAFSSFKNVPTSIPSTGLPKPPELYTQKKLQEELEKLKLISRLTN